MKSIYIYLLLCLLLFSCNSDESESEIICDFPGAITSNLFIELVNAQGENLIENGTYIPTDITIDFNGNTLTNVVFTKVEGLENFAYVGIFGEDGDNAFEINLSDTETDALVLNLTREEISGPCAQFVFRLNSAGYNDELKEIQSYGGDFLITVVKE
jgi:hypothetical protein